MHSVRRREKQKQRKEKGEAGKVHSRKEENLPAAPPVALALSVVVLSVALLYVGFLVNRSVSQPYMDEEFHYRQAAAFCRELEDEEAESTWQWLTGPLLLAYDPKITTPPGLYYFLSLQNQLLNAISHLLGAGGDSYECQNLLNMRMALIPVGAVSFVVFAATISAMRQGKGRQAADISVSSLLAAMQMTLLPVGFFFLFLIYNESLSVMLVFLAHLLAVRGYMVAAAAVSLVSLTFRQTNLVWVIFIVASTILVRSDTRSQLEDVSEKRKKREGLTGAVSEVFAFLRFCFVTHLGALIKIYWPFLVVVAASCAFLWANDMQVALGDQIAHSLVFHAPQFLYFLVFSCGFLPLRSLTGILPAVRQMRFLPLLIVLSLAGAAVHFFTVEHLYLISDNRHYVFYLWKNVFRKWHLARYCLLPAYGLAAYVVFGHLLGHRSVLWRSVFGLAVAGAVVPSGLLEFRYFIVPFLFLFLYAVTPAPGQEKESAEAGKWGTRSTVITALEILFYVAVNAATIYVFLFKPFTAPDGSVGRFMW